jgi:outer membrane protein OmpA-like peptidoglycan-associated protein
VPLPEAKTVEAETDSETQVPLPAPKPFTRPALIVTDKKPPAAPRTVLKTAEVTMPISETEYEQLAENMETVPVQVALAPPKPVYAPKAVSTADLTLEFDRTAESLSTAAQSKLKNIIAHMNADTAAKLQVRAYATGDDGSKASARSKSLTRATEVRSFLMDNGIKPTRVIVRALGQETDRKPLDRIELTFVK